MVTVSDVLKAALVELESVGIDNPNLDSRLLLESILNISREDIFLKSSQNISDDDKEKFFQLIERRKNREPVSRILGYRHFWKYKFLISEETLDPRPDTEILVEQVLKYCSHQGTLNILDLGTGSGCILLSLLAELPLTNGVGLDISADAIKTSNKNANSLNLINRVSFINSSWVDFKPDSKFDIVVSNPPYIEEDEINNLEEEVKDFDPITALSGGNDGLKCYREIVNLLPLFLKKNGWVFLEIGYNQRYDVKEILAKGGFTVLDIVKDLAGHDRCVIARWN